MLLICPVCSTNNQANEFCTQCGADLQVHHLLSAINEARPMECELGTVKQKTTCWLNFFQILPAVLLSVCTLFGIYVGMHFLMFLERAESQQSSVGIELAQISFTQVQQLNSIIKQELDLILEQHHENQNLQIKLEELTVQMQKVKVELYKLKSVSEEPE